MRGYLVGLIGSGITESLTPALHMAEARSLGLDYLYRTIDLELLGIAPAEVGRLVRAAQMLGFDALNITHPCKQLVVAELDRLDPTAARLGAVNTVIFEPGAAVGYNTDSTGFATAFATGLAGAGVTEVVQLGAGGAGAAVADALLNGGVQHLTLVDPDDDRAARLAAALTARFAGAQVESSHPDKLSALLPESDGLVHCTPTGMAAHPGLPLDPALLHPRLWVADIVYRPLQTALLRAASDLGCRTLNGGSMAVHQAADTLTLVTGLTPDAERMTATFQTLVAGEPS